MVAATKPEPDAIDEALKMIFADIKKMDNPTKEKIAASLMQVLADNA